MEKIRRYVVYLIGDSVATGYVGVTHNKTRRWKHHTHSNYLVGDYIRQNKLTFSETVMKTLYEGAEDECFDLERKLRPYPYMGLNMAPGGHGGLREYTAERNRKISQALKGRKHSWGNKSSKTKKDFGLVVGEKNPMAKKWKFTSPAGDEYVIIGNKQKFCDEYQLLASCLVYHLGMIVPPIEEFCGKGGYRAKNKMSLHKRCNSVGWKLEILK